MTQIKALIIDDERAAREELKRLLSNYPEFTITGEATNADDAAKLIKTEQPDVIFLDIQMPGKSGFELLEELLVVPEVIFVTAYDQYALKAFEVSALDYLMKPIRIERFEKAVLQLQAKLKIEVREQQQFVKDGNKYHTFAWSQVQLIASMDNYARLSIGDKVICIKKSLNQLEKELDEALFFRVNRAQIVNLKYSFQVSTNAAGRLVIQLTTGEILEASDRQTVKFKNRTIL